MIIRIEQEISAALGRVMRFSGPRIAVIFISAIYLALLVIAPTQLVDVLRSDWLTGDKLAWVAGRASLPTLNADETGNPEGPSGFFGVKVF